MFGAIYTPGLLSGQWPDGNRFLTPFAFPGRAARELFTASETAELFVPRLPCTMTEKTFAGCACASSIRLAGTSARAA